MNAPVIARDALVYHQSNLLLATHDESAPLYLTLVAGGPYEAGNPAMTALAVLSDVRQGFQRVSYQLIGAVPPKSKEAGPQLASIMVELAEHLRKMGLDLVEDQAQKLDRPPPDRVRALPGLLGNSPSTLHLPPGALPRALTATLSATLAELPPAWAEVTGLAPSQPAEGHLLAKPGPEGTAVYIARDAPVFTTDRARGLRFGTAKWIEALATWYPTEFGGAQAVPSWPTTTH